jgi:WD40 repeat protein
MDGLTTVWQLPSENMIVSFASTAAMDLNADGSLLAYVSPDGYLHLWDIIKRADRSVSKAPLSFLPDEWNGEVTFSPQGNLLAVAGGDCQIFLLTAITGKQIATLNRTHDCWEGPIAFSPDESIVVFGDRNFTHFYNVRMGKEYAINPCCGRSVVALAFSPNGKVVVAAADEGGGQAIYDPGTGDLLEWQTISNSVAPVDINTCPTSASGVTFTKDSRLMVIGTFVCLWLTDLVTGEPLFTIKSLAPNPSVAQYGQSYFMDEPGAFNPSQTLLSTVETTIFSDAQGHTTDKGMGIIRLWGIPSG